MSAEFVTAANLAPRHGFFTRKGGVSEGPFGSLNASLSSADVRENVMENRARIARAIGAEPANLLGLTQVHSADVIIARGKDMAGALMEAAPGDIEFNAGTYRVVGTDKKPVYRPDTSAYPAGT